MIPTKDQPAGSAVLFSPPTRTSRTTSMQMHHIGGHSMKWMMPLCALGMVAGVVVWAGWGVNIGGLFCMLMMVAMIWMMVAPTVGKVRHRDHSSR